MNKKTLIKVCAVTCGLSLTLAGCTSSNNSNEINNTKKYNTEINSQDTEKTGSKEIINKKIDENLYIDATLQMPETQLNEYNTKLKDFNLKDIMAYLYPDIKESDLVKDDAGGFNYDDSYIGGEAGSMSYSKDDDTSYLQLLCGYADEKKLAETKELQFESITEARAQVKELTDKMGIPGELGKENITAFNSADLNNIQSNMEQDSDYKDLLSAKKQQSMTFGTDTEIYCFTYGIKIDGLQVYANDDPILQQTRDVLITQPVNIEVMISNRGIESVFVSGIMEEPDVCNANVDIIGEKGITEALNKRFGDVILTDEYKATNIWMEYFPLLQNDSFTDIKLIPVWCLDFEVNGNGAEAGGYTIRINAITGDEIA